MVYDNIKSIANQKGISITQLEEKAELGNGTIGKWKKGNATIAKIEKVALALNVPIEKLVKD